LNQLPIQPQTFFALLIALALTFPVNNEVLAQEAIVVEKAVASHIENILIPTEEEGVVREVRVREGDAVKQGQVLVQLNSEVQELQLNVAEAELRSAELTARNTTDIQFAEKSSEMARKTLERSTQANQRSQRAVSQTEIERLTLEYERGLLAAEQAKMQQAIAQAQVVIKQAEMDAARLRLSRRRIHAPISGKIVECLAQPGEWVSGGQPLIRVVRLDRLRVQCILSAKKFDESLIGSPVEFEVEVPPDGQPMVFQGVVTFVSPEVILQRDQIAVWAEVENTDMKLRPNNSGTLRILPK